MKKVIFAVALLSLITLKAVATPTETRFGNGTPLTEFVDGAGRGYSTSAADIASGVSFYVNSLRSVGMRKISPPEFAITMVSKNTEPKWSGRKGLHFSFSGRRVYIAGYKSTKQSNDIYIESLVVIVPNDIFKELCASKKFYVTIGNASFTVPEERTVGMRELARRYK